MTEHEITIHTKDEGRFIIFCIRPHLHEQHEDYQFNFELACLVDGPADVTFTDLSLANIRRLGRFFTDAADEIDREQMERPVSAGQTRTHDEVL